MDFSHIPVLHEQVIEHLQIRPGGIYVDGTVGGGGHSSEILRRLEDGLLVGIDQDDAALAAAEKRLSAISDRFVLAKGNFVHMDAILDENGIDRVDGILLDIGVSSHQFDTPERGFSYRFDGPLDMRMDGDGDIRAYDIVNRYSADEITDILLRYGEERWAKRIAEFIVSERNIQPIDTTFRLVEIIKKAIPAKVRRDGGHPAKKSFQALRIAVNRELEVLEEAIPMMVDRLKPKGRLAIITFHSLEDRIVKNTFKYLHQDCICPPRQPICTCNKKREIRIVTRKPVVADDAELATNNRAHSAKLRVAEKL
ncbi:Ribosomal RNA small subunit methyltransferase H [Aedoeadaptatus ivorii]|uniref:Ribosomal RNA small subunit methyltransferase H n=1 Tax=Aedoeadaptatus ivorii TaxID=54006 RepID=A0A3S4YPM9_9FIRM|nr:16S rRNA (cytosine(1402)-N(4))-methyltransferase RsmH [Peptoniphilus ivorii]MDQ0508943.1 16S rRNA (cytosine1402-N4)-methyltransferase [Peptoniphilus ivorii]VEJ35769.1 Ribosomal RNA small subunit methyltransferase H [Peptoniphilus ivorii]